VTDERTQPIGDGPDELELSGEEDVAGSSSPGKDLGSAIVVGLLAIAAMVFSIRLDVPGALYTAPGLLPFITGLTLFMMAVVLGTRAVRAGGTSGSLRKFTAGAVNAATDYLNDEEGRRTLLLVSIVTAYVLLVAFINFDLRFPTPIFTFQLSSYEVISVVMITWILRLFWKASSLRCFVVALVTIEVLVTIFRYGFGILMPETF